MALYKMVNLPSDDLVQYVGVYVLKWNNVVDGTIVNPTVGFVEVEDNDEEYSQLPEPED